MRKRTLLSALGFAVSIAIILLALYFTDLNKTIEILSKANEYLVLVAITSLTTFVAKGFRWHLMLKHSETRSSLKESFYSFFAGSLFSTFTPGRIGEPIRSYFLKKMNGASMSKTLSLILLERIIDLMVLSFLSLAAIYFLSSETAGFKGIGLIAIALISAIIVLLFLVAYEKTGKKIVGFASRFVKQLGSINFELFYSALSKFRRKRRLLLYLLLTLFVWAAEGAVFYFSLLSVNTTLPLFVAISLTGLAFIVGIVSFLPGGLGSSEA
ncbi:MAG: lysylphosphatidylglycerol synthase transmembrane domain-containing protein, partial [Candidatus Micrarchaeia archaeon]